MKGVNGAFLLVLKSASVKNCMRINNTLFFFFGAHFLPILLLLRTNTGRSMTSQRSFLFPGFIEDRDFKTSTTSTLLLSHPEPSCQRPINLNLTSKGGGVSLKREPRHTADHHRFLVLTAQQ